MSYFVYIAVCTIQNGASSYTFKSELVASDPRTIVLVQLYCTVPAVLYCVHSQLSTGTTGIQFTVFEYSLYSKFQVRQPTRAGSDRSGSLRDSPYNSMGLSSDWELPIQTCGAI